MIFISSVFLFTQSSLAQNILAVDRDGSAWTTDFTDCWPYYQAALDANGYTYTYYEVTDGALDGPDLTTMQEHDIIIWFTGEVWSNGQTMTANDETNLAAFLDGGGSLFISAQDYLWDKYPSAGNFSPGEFPYDYLGLRTVVQDNWVIASPEVGTASGVAGSLAEGMEFDLQDIFTTAREGLFIDEITDHVGLDMLELTVPTPTGICAVQYELRSFKSVFTSASFAAIVDPVDQADFLAAIVGYFTGGAACFPYFDDFESYTPIPGYLALLSPCWDTWSHAPGTGEDAYIVDDNPYSGLYSVKIEGTSTDLIFGMGDKTVGAYEISMYMYIETGYGAYFNLLHEFTAERTEWAIESYFASDGTGYIHAGGANAATFTYPPATWFQVKTIVDLDADWAEYYVDGVFVHEWQWSLQSGGSPGLNQLGAMDIFAAAPPGDDVLWYFDDVNYDVYVSCDPYFDDIESYIAGDYFALQATCWTTWSGAPGTGEDAFVSTDQAYSGVNSVFIEGSSTDLVLPFGDKTEGKYEVSMYMYIEPGYGAYYNLLHEFTGDRTEWALEAFFASDGTGYINAGGGHSADFFYTPGEWFMVKTIVDLDEDFAEYFVADTLVHEWQWSLEAGGSQGLNQLGAMDIFAHAPASDSPMWYFDDVNYMPIIPPPICEGFDDLTVGGYAAEQLGGLWTTWSNTPGTAEDAIVVDVVSLSPNNSIIVEGSTDLVKLFAENNLETGKYAASLNLYVADGFCGYFNLQKDVIPGTEWGFQVMFDVDGVATVDAGGAGAATFNFNFDEWILNELIVDLNNDWAEYYVNGTLIVEWQWTLGTFGNPGALTLGSYNIYAWASSGNSPKAYVDNVCFEEISAAECEYFDDLTVGGYAALQLGGLWTTWSNTPGTAEDAIVVDSISLSPNNSIIIEGTTDLIKLFANENLEVGKYSTTLNLYVADGFCGYFNLQKDVIPGTEWGFQVMFDVDSVATVDAGGAAAATFNYNPNEWIFNELIVDLNNDWAEYYVNGTLIVEWQWTLGTFGNPGALTLGGYNIYAWASSGNSPKAFVDNVCFEVLVPIGTEEPIAQESASSITIYPNPARDYINVISSDNIIEVRIFNNIGQLIYSQNVDNNNFKINTSNYHTGMYIIQVRTTEGVEVNKVIIE